MTSDPMPLYAIAHQADGGADRHGAAATAGQANSINAIAPPTIVSAPSFTPSTECVCGLRRTLYNAQQNDPQSTSTSPKSELCDCPAMPALEISAIPSTDSRMPPHTF